MTDTEFKRLEDIAKKFEAINQKLDSILEKLDHNSNNSTNELTSRSLINGLMHICTHPNFSDEQYCNALCQIKDLDYSISPKQFSWIMAYTFRHTECGDSIQAFIKATLKKVEDSGKYINDVAYELRKNYANEKNSQFIEGIIKHLRTLI